MGYREVNESKFNILFSLEHRVTARILIIFCYRQKAQPEVQVNCHTWREESESQQ